MRIQPTGSPRRRALTACLAIPAALLAAELVGGVAVARADAACSTGRSCPRIAAVSPSLLDGAPARAVDVTLQGSGLTGIEDATLLPGGLHLRVVSPGDTSMVVEIPAGALASGQSYRLQVSVGSQPNDTVQSPPIAVVSAAAARAAVSLAPAPTVPPAATPVARPVVATAPSAAPSSSGSSMVGGLLIWMVGLLVGGGACLAFAIRTGLIRESRWASLALDRFGSNEVPALPAPLPARLQQPRRPAAPTWTLAPGTASPEPPATQDGPVAEPATVEPPRPAWGIREQSKPDGAATRYRTPSH